MHSVVFPFIKYCDSYACILVFESLFFTNFILLFVMLAQQFKPQLSHLGVRAVTYITSVKNEPMMGYRNDSVSGIYLTSSSLR